MSPENSKVEEMHRDRAFINEYNARIAAILRPAVHLIDFAENSPKQFSPRIKDDMLREAVVFLHATLEDFLRYIGSKFNAQADLDKRSFGNTDRVSELLESVGVPKNEVKKLYPSLRKLMARRHEIVHNGDVKGNINTEGERDPEPIKASEVKEWSETIINFTSEVAAYILKTGV
jgi:hypothetical protein